MAEYVKSLKDIDIKKVRSMILNCENCGVITCVEKSKNFICGKCGKCALVLEGVE